MKAQILFWRDLAIEMKKDALKEQRLYHKDIKLNQAILWVQDSVRNYNFTMAF